MNLPQVACLEVLRRSTFLVKTLFDDVQCGPIHFFLSIKQLHSTSIPRLTCEWTVHNNQQMFIQAAELTTWSGPPSTDHSLRLSLSLSQVLSPSDEQAHVGGILL